MYINRLPITLIVHIIYREDLKSVLPDFLHHFQSHPLPSIHYLFVYECHDSDVRALTTFLPQCTNLHTLHYRHGQQVSEMVEEELWEAAVRRCRNLEEMIVRGENMDCDVSCKRLGSVLRSLPEKGRTHALKLKRIVREVWDPISNDITEEDYTEQVKHLLPVLQQQHKCCCLL